MFAGVTTFEGPHEHVDDFRHALVQHMLPALSEPNKTVDWVAWKHG
jgi:hypothetical protein